MANGLTDTTIYIPACTRDPYTWAAGEKLLLQTDSSKVIRLIGSGQNATRIVHFQIDVPDSTKLNLVEFGHIGCNGNQEIGSMLDYRLRPETLNTEFGHCARNWKRRRFEQRRFRIRLFHHDQSSVMDFPGGFTGTS